MFSNVFHLQLSHLDAKASASFCTWYLCSPDSAASRCRRCWTAVHHRILGPSRQAGFFLRASSQKFQQINWFKCVKGIEGAWSDQTPENWPVKRIVLLILLLRHSFCFCFAACQASQICSTWTSQPLRWRHHHSAAPSIDTATERLLTCPSSAKSALVMWIINLIALLSQTAVECHCHGRCAMMCQGLGSAGLIPGWLGYLQHMIAHACGTAWRSCGSFLGPHPMLSKWARASSARPYTMFFGTTDVQQISTVFSMIISPSMYGICPNLSNAHHFRAWHQSSKCGPSREPTADQTWRAQLVTVWPA